MSEDKRCKNCARFVRVVETIDANGEVKRSGDCLLGAWDLAPTADAAETVFALALRDPSQDVRRVIVREYSRLPTKVAFALLSAAHFGEQDPDLKASFVAAMVAAFL